MGIGHADDIFRLAITCQFMIAVSDENSRIIERDNQRQYANEGYTLRELNMDEITDIARSSRLDNGRIISNT